MILHRSAQVFDQDHLVLRFVIEQFVGNCTGHGNAKSARTHAELITDNGNARWTLPKSREQQRDEDLRN